MYASGTNVWGSAVIYLDVELPSSHTLPSQEEILNWRNDLKRARDIETDLQFSSLTRRLLAKVGAGRAKEMVAELKAFVSSWRKLTEVPWAARLFEMGLHGDEVFQTLKAQLDASANDFWNDAEAAKPFSTAIVTIPDEMPPPSEQHQIIGSLATGSNPFGLFAFKLKPFKPVFDRILINGKKAESESDWKHVAS